MSQEQTDLMAKLTGEFKQITLEINEYTTRSFDFQIPLEIHEEGIINLEYVDDGVNPAYVYVITGLLNLTTKHYRYEMPSEDWYEDSESYNMSAFDGEEDIHVMY